MGDDVRFGSLADMCSAKEHVRFPPNSDRKSEHSALVDRAGMMARLVTLHFASLPLVNEPANRQGQQIYFGIAATDGHDADRVCIFERSSHPAFARPRGSQASPRYAGMSARA